MFKFRRDDLWALLPVLVIVGYVTLHLLHWL